MFDGHIVCSNPRPTTTRSLTMGKLLKLKDTEADPRNGLRLVWGASSWTFFCQEDVGVNEGIGVGVDGLGVLDPAH